VSSEPRFIGYDLRIAPEVAARDWPDARRNQYLLRRDLVNPLSVDSMVWPRPSEVDDESLFEKFGYGFVGLTANPPLLLKGVSVAVAVYPAIWSELQQQAWDPLVRSRAGVNEGLKSLYGNEIAGPNEAEFQFLGYDVADWGLISGVANCGFGADEPVDDYRIHWGTKLNQYHLFDDIGTAHVFTEFADRRVPEHAPFFVFGLWCQTA